MSIKLKTNLLKIKGEDGNFDTVIPSVSGSELEEVNSEIAEIKETYQSLVNKFDSLVEYIKTHVVNDDNGAGLDAIIGGDTPVNPPSQTVTVSVSGSTMNVTGFTATTVTQSGSTLNVA